MNINLDPRTVLSAAPTANEPDKARTLEELRQATREFEALYVFEMYKAMRKNVPDGGLIQKDSASKMYQDILDMELARTTAKDKGMGLGEAMYIQLKDKVSK